MLLLFPYLLKVAVYTIYLGSLFSPWVKALAIFLFASDISLFFIIKLFSKTSPDFKL